MNPQNEIILYNPSDTVQLEVRLENETVWLTQAQMVLLFGRDQSVISKHIGNVFREKELDAKSNMQILHITNIDRPVSFNRMEMKAGEFLKNIK
jgi:hypothetical protein